MKRLLTTLVVFLFAATPLAQDVDWAKVANKVAWSVTALMTPAEDVYCSGFVIDTERGLVLTADHCVAAADDRGFPLSVDGYPAEEIYHNPSRDLALLKTTTEKAPLQPASGVEVGMQVMGIGWAEGNPPSAIVTTVTGLDYTTPFFPGLWLSTGPDNFIGGMSGGPIVDSAGDVVGMVQMYQIEDDGTEVDFGNSIMDLMKFVVESGAFNEEAH